MEARIVGSFECMIGACLVDTFKAWLIENQVVGQ